ncbi:MAG: hypothetical protein HQL51_14335 [Magnetococcales bacterium]|nr:hypothetical protein [Magnetococcales bacterium]
MIMRSPQEGAEDLAILVGKIKGLEQDVELIKATMIQQAQTRQEEIRVVHEQLESLRTHLQAINETLNRQSRSFALLEKRVDGVRTDFSTGIALSVLVFSVLFVISLFVR